MNKNTFYIKDNTWNKILGYARMTYDLMSTEIGGMAVVRKESDDMWIISDATILKQEVTGVICHLDKEELANWYSAMAVKYLEDLKEKKLMYCWWHSHHTMGASMSTTDWDTIGNTKTGLSLVVNNDGEHELILCASEPINIQVQCELKTISSVERDDTMKEEIERLVTKEITTIRSAYTRNGWGKSIDTVSSQLNLLPTEDTTKVDPIFDGLEPVITDTPGFGQEDVTIDALSLEVDIQLDGLREGTRTPQEVIDYLESCNNSLNKPVFKIPPPDEILTIDSSFELMNSNGWVS